MRRIVKAELVKLTTTRTLLWSTLALVLLQGLTILAALLFASEEGRFALTDEFTQRTVLSSGGTYGVIVILLGILGMTSDYRHGTITPTLLVAPRREQVVIAKIVVHALAGCLLGLLSTALTLAVALPGLAARGADLALSGDDLVAIFAGGLVYFTLAGAFGLGVGALVRQQVAAIAAVLVLFFVVENIMVTLVPEASRWLPGQAASALYFPGPPAPEGTGLGAIVLSQPAGGALFAVYAAVLCAAGIMVTRARDIT
jgi:ABC-2 type transport system permease protein